MKLRPSRLVVIAATGLSLAFGHVLVERQSHSQPEATPATGAAAETEGIEELTTGPLHEAYASPNEPDPAPTEVVPKAPPEDIVEEPPAYRPEGDAVWINGYWDWEPEMKEFIWVSGMWRVSPPGMRWVPGYWTETTGGFQRVRGFWVSADAAEIEYRDPPPESVDVGPATPAPSQEHFYVPGVWNYYETGYRWRPGYWSPYVENWIWIPARWAWTPAGCVYLPGYWDYRLTARGQLFAPVYFHDQYYARPGFVYRPRYVLNASNLLLHLWVGPRYNSYYFGNYYGGGFGGGIGVVGGGFSPIPWWQYNQGRRYYDPLMAWYGVHYRRQGVDFYSRMQGWNRYYANNRDRRPTRTVIEQNNIINIRGDDNTVILASDLRQIVNREGNRNRFVEVTDRDRERIRSRSRELTEVRTERSKLERQALLASADGRGQNRVEALRPDLDNPNRGADAARDAARDSARSGRREVTKLKLPKASADTSATATASTPPAPDRVRDGDRGNSEGRGGDRASDSARTLPGADRPGRDASDAARDAARASRDNDGRDADRPGRGNNDRTPGTDRTIDRTARPDRDVMPPTERDAPRVELPGRSDRDSRPDSTPRASDSRIDRPGDDSRGKGSGDNRSKSGRGGDSAPRQPRIESTTPRVETPRVETSRPDSPRI